MLTSFTTTAKDLIGRLTDITHLKFTFLLIVCGCRYPIDVRMLLSRSWHFGVEFLHSCRYFTIKNYYKAKGVFFVLQASSPILFNFIGMQQVASHLEKRFATTAMYKRSKQYFDIYRLNKLQSKEELSRRRPPDQSRIASRLDGNFVSAQKKLSERLQTECSKHQKRLFMEDKEELETNYTFDTDRKRNPPLKKGKTLDMSKMLSRDYYEKECAQCFSEEHFCNFRAYEVPKNHKVDFKKYYTHKLPRKGQQKRCQRCINKTQTLESSELNGDIVGKIHETLIFDQSLFKTMVDFKKNDKEKSEDGDEESPQKKYDLIYRGEHMTTKKPRTAAAQFYHGMTKWSAPQMDNRLVPAGTYFLQAYNKRQQAQIDWSMVKRKSDMTQKRKKELMQRKRIPDIKGQICDDLYFRRNP